MARAKGAEHGSARRHRPGAQCADHQAGVRRAYEKDGVTVIPAARVQGGAGAGGGEDPQGQGTGSGSGFAMTARPVGAFIIRDCELSWRPAVDVNRIVLGGQVVAVVALLTVRAISKARAK